MYDFFNEEQDEQTVIGGVIFVNEVKFLVLNVIAKWDCFVKFKEESE